MDESQSLLLNFIRATSASCEKCENFDLEKLLTWPLIYVIYNSYQSLPKHDHYRTRTVGTAIFTPTKGTYRFVGLVFRLSIQYIPELGYRKKTIT